MTSRANRIPRVVATRPGLLSRLHRFCVSLRIRFLLWEAKGIHAERAQYEDTGAVGPIYLFNSHRAELELLLKARRLERGL